MINSNQDIKYDKIVSAMKKALKTLAKKVVEDPYTSESTVEVESIPNNNHNSNNIDVENINLPDEENINLPDEDNEDIIQNNDMNIIDEDSREDEMQEINNDEDITISIEDDRPEIVIVSIVSKKIISGIKIYKVVLLHDTTCYLRYDNIPEDIITKWKMKKLNK